MTDQRQHLTTEDFAERTPVEQTPDDRDVAEPNLTDQERFDREPVPHNAQPAHGSPTDDSATYDSATDDSATYDSATQDRSTYGSPTHEAARDEASEHVEPATDQQAAWREEPVEPSAVDTTPGDSPLFTPDDAADYQAEWRALQADFVDDPREAVQRADELVAQVMQSLATTFNDHKHALEEQWQQGEQVQTEELRQALKRYRAFFDRLLSV
ncbi:hypothetical protein [Saccharothrix luteola]|uniref:hypothetical protein n=1 Tax=Saccharothrix luteola TaxID=2893018 RepID=UPI001E3EC6C7|nr:hypothetical protein [Saccharothrix luteola]MCC8244603.1 hypothetical protein [Saccharothrix luteola]